MNNPQPMAPVMQPMHVKQENHPSSPHTCRFSSVVSRNHRINQRALIPAEKMKNAICDESEAKEGAVTRRASARVGAATRHNQDHTTRTDIPELAYSDTSRCPRDNAEEQAADQLMPIPG